VVGLKHDFAMEGATAMDIEEREITFRELGLDARLEVSWWDVAALVSRVTNSDR
jgi:hypothetical protein